MKKLYIMIILMLSMVISILVSIFIPGHLNNIGNFIDFAVDSNLNVYKLSYKSKTGEFKISRIDQNGNVKASKNLDASNGEYTKSYEKLKVDQKGNILLKMTDKYAKGADEINAIKSEKILMYDIDLNFVKEIAEVDFSDRESLLIEPYIFDYQVIKDEVKIFCKDGNNYEILSTNTVDSCNPTNEQKFSIIPDASVSSDTKWVSDMAVSSNGKVIYSDYKGEIYILEGGEVKNITNDIGIDNAYPRTFSVDSNDNLYFTDIVNMNFYQLNMQNLNLKQLYNKDSVINKKGNICFGDIKNISYISDGEFCSILQTTSGEEYIDFGVTENHIKNIKNNNIFFQVILFFVSSIAIFFIIYGLVKIVCKIKEKTTLTLKIALGFLPVYILAMVILFFIVIYNLADQNKNNLTNTQETNARIIAENIDGNLFKNISTHKSYLTDDYIKLSDQVESICKKMVCFDELQPDYIMLYTVNDGVIYRSYAKGLKEENSANPEKEVIIEDASIIPINYKYGKETAEKYYSLWDNMSEFNRLSDEKYNLLVSDSGSKFVSGFEPICDSGGNIVGFVESRIDRLEHKDMHFYKNIMAVVISVILITMLIFIYFIIVIRFSFLPLREIKRYINDIVAGKWDSRINIKSKDEFVFIGKGFKLMSDKIIQYTSGNILLNKEYLKFVPKDLFKLLGKSRVTDIDLNDRNVRVINVVSIKFDVKEEDYLTVQGINEYFEKTNKKYLSLFDIVNRNNGVVEKFDVFGTTVLFLENPFDAVAASMQFAEQFSGDVSQSNFRIALGSVEATIGVMGSSDRMSVAIISEELILMEYISKFVNKMGIRHFAMQSMIDATQNRTIFNSCRFIGQIKHPNKDKPVKIYEIISTASSYEKKLYNETKPIFEKGVDSYIKGDIAGARRIFVAILKVNESDKMAMHYFGLCNSLDYKKTKDWKGYLF